MTILSPDDARKESVQILPKVNPYGSVDNETYWFQTAQRGPLLPAWGTHERERFLRVLYRNDFNWMIQGAFAGLLKRISSTPWEIKGPENVTGKALDQYKRWLTVLKGGKDPTEPRSDIEYWQTVLRQAHFNRGWGDFIKMGVDFLRQDAGWYWEIIAPGDPLKEPTGPVVGIAHLDSLRCVPTGDPDYPVVYWDRRNAPHRMHRTRVVQLQDMPEHDEFMPGYGLCALSRAAAIVDRELWMGRYVSSMLDDKPPPGIVVATGFNKQQRDAMARAYKEEQTRDELPPWGRQMWFYGMDITFPIKLEVKTFQTPPEKFDFNQYTQIDIDALALALGVDKQDLWQLSGRMAGTAAQSEVLSQKSRGKALGDMMASIERAINDILPEEYVFKFKGHDSQEEQEEAQTALAWANVVNVAGVTLSVDEKRRILADTVPQVHDAITDADGKIQSGGDRDLGPIGAVTSDPQNAKPTPNVSGNQGSQETLAAVGDTAAGAGGTGGQDVALAGHKHAAVGTDAGGTGEPSAGQQLDAAAAAVKQIQSTLLNFEMDFADLVAAALSGSMDRTRFGIVGRAMLKKYGTTAFQDGLKAGGVEGELSEEDQAELSLWIAETNGYFSAFAARVFSGESQMTADARAQAWGNKSIMDAYRDGQLSADRNSLYEWVLDSPEESCSRCPQLNGQIHRLSSWKRRGLLPASDALPCKMGCKCKLAKTNGKARGRF